MKKKIYCCNVIKVALLILILMILYVYRFIYLYPYASSWDQVDFVLALQDFDLLKMQPHFPGYPFFILGGTLFIDRFGPRPEVLSFFNHLMMISSCIPIYYIARTWLPITKSLVVVLTLQSMSYPTVIVAQPMSEGAALATVYWFLWSIHYASIRKSLLSNILPFFFFSVLLGIRLSYISFGVGLLFHVYQIWKQNLPLKKVQISTYVLLGIFLQFIWIGALAINVGGFTTLWAIATGFSEGHFTEWGGTAEEGNIGDRILKLVFINILWVGYFSENIYLLVLYLCMFGLVLVHKRKINFQSLGTFYILIVGMTGVYFVWALLAQNIDKPRHSIPLVVLSLLLFTILLLKTKSSVAITLLLLWIGVHGHVGTTLVEKQAAQLPAVYELEEYLRMEHTPFIVYTWEETRTFEYLESPFLHKRVYSYTKFKSELDTYENKKIYLTGHVVRGFEAQGVDVNNKVRKLAEFRSDPLFDPVYSKIDLYEWVGR